MGPNANLKEKQCEGTSTTQQLLADLTNDFEEAITAQICLSNQFLDANLNCKIENTKDILILKSQSVDTAKSNQSPMESNKTLETTSDEQKQNADENVVEDKTENESESLNSTFELKVEEETPTKSTVDDPSKVATTPTKQDVARPSIISVEELPPIRTDSTMTASEAEDNIEERLSQLDGTPVQPLTSCDVSSMEQTIMGTIPATPPRTPPPTIRQQQHSNQSQVQTQQSTPTTPLTQHVQQLVQQRNSFTPQSSTSSVNTMGSTNIPKDFMKDSAGELEDQDIEEVLKALKGLDSSTAADTICDLNVLFNEVYTTLNYEEINSQNASTKPNPLKEAQAEIEQKQLTMQRKIDFLLRRLRKVQSRYMCKHTSEEISGLFDWSARIVSKSAKLSHEDDVNERQQLNYAEEKSHPVTSTQISTMLRKIELVANAQQLSISSSSNLASNFNNRRKMKKVVNSTLDVEHKVATVVPTFDEKVTEEIAHVTGLLQSEMHEIQNSIDSDATESSSGGESADEMVTYNNQIQQSLHIAKRAAWRYSRDRAAIASRWSWLLSQISDLEIKIRQHSELHQEIIRTKGSVVNKVETNANPSSTTAATAAAPFNGYKGAQPTTSDTKDSNDEQELSGCCRTRGILASNFRKRKLFQTTNIHTFSKKAARPSTIKCGCQWPLHPCALCTGRTDPTAPRDLPDTMMLSDRVALLDPGYHPVLSFPEDISNSIHFEGISRLPEWQQRIMRCPVKNIAKSVWKAEREAISGKKNSDSIKRKYIKKKDLHKEQQQQQQQPNNGNGTGTLSMSSTPLVANTRHHYPSMSDAEMSMKITPALNNNNTSSSSNHIYHQPSEYRHQSSAQYNPSQAHSSSISNIVRSSKNRKLSASTANSTFHYNHHLNDNNNYSNNESNYLHSDSWDSLVTRSRTSSPTHGSSSNYHKYERSLDRRNRTSYDIDNIVIPYSVAAATRVEILPYKEIPTPKWRLIEEESEATIDSSIESTKSNPHEESSSSVVNNNNNNNKDESKDFLEFPKAENLNIESKKQKTNNIAAGINTVGISTASETEAINSTENSKSRLTTKRTYSEKENSVDPIDAFDSIKDSNYNSTKELNGGESVTKKCKTAEAKDDAKDIGAQLNLENDSKGKLIESDLLPTDAEAVEDATEDISEEAMVSRHEKALVEERRKFQTYLKFPWSTRSRANRRIDSRAESSGTNTPDPASPAPNTPSVGGGDLESIPSPAPPLTPLNPLESIAEVGETSSGLSSVFNNSIAPPPSSMQNCFNKRYERRRTTSAKKDREQERRSSTPDSKELIPPFEPLKFPIPNEIFDNMIKMMPLDHHEDTIDDDNIHNISMKISNSDLDIKNSSTISKSYNIGDKNISSSSSIGGGASRRDRNEYDSEIGFIEDDGYSKHHLAPDDDYPFDSYKNKKNNGGGDSDMDSSEAEPFSDDDPNDPEWKGEPEERDRIRRKI